MPRGISVNCNDSEVIRKDEVIRLIGVNNFIWVKALKDFDSFELEKDIEKYLSYYEKSYKKCSCKNGKVLNEQFIFCPYCGNSELESHKVGNKLSDYLQSGQRYITVFLSEIVFSDLYIDFT